MYMKKIAILIIASAMAAGGMAQKRPPAYKTLTFDVKGCRLEMVYVHGGEFVMGCDEGMEAYGKVDERPYHPVRVNSFYMGRYEVTQRLWKAVMGSNPSNFRGDDCPVEQVSYDDAQEFIRRLNAFSGKKFRLPTEAEWEYAARGGRYGRGKNYAGDNDPLRAGWGMLNSGDSTHLAGGLVPNELGLYDMTGNVWEWCSDWYDSDEYGWRNRDILFPAPPSWVHTRDDFKRWADTPYDQKPSAARAMATQRAASSQSVKHALTVDSYSVIDNPQGPESGECRVGRGGSWCDVPEDMRVSYRNFWMPDRRLSNVGFRLAMEYDKDDSALAWMPGQYVLDSIADGEQYRASGLEVIMRRENGVLEGLFSVAPDRLVRFAKGNLQYNASTLGWRLADRQTDYIGEGNTKLKKGYAGWTDLFAWGTSGYRDKDPAKLVSNPAMLGNGADKNIDGTSYDWGIYNSIAGGGSRPGLWRTLSVYEWAYLFTGRPDARWLHTQGCIITDTAGRGRSTEGAILLPDNWLQRGFDTLNPGTLYVFTPAEWAIMEYAGAVFLPAAGTCSMGGYHEGIINLEMEADMGGVEGVDVSFGNRIPMVHEAVSEMAKEADGGSGIFTIADMEFYDKTSFSQHRRNLEGPERIGYYWSTVHYDKRNAMAMAFAVGRSAAIIPVERLVRCSVRLVQDAEANQELGIKN